MIGKMSIHSLVCNEMKNGRPRSGLCGLSLLARRHWRAPWWLQEQRRRPPFLAICRQARCQRPGPEGTRLSPSEMVLAPCCQRRRWTRAVETDHGRRGRTILVSLVPYKVQKLTQILDNNKVEGYFILHCKGFARQSDLHCAAANGWPTSRGGVTAIFSWLMRPFCV